ncbi:NAD(P)/FAD-dependent oxidoreductase [Candidatus Protochlamydia phocaeensis]|uniref:NAD(P)/FAD-dependent oxidoreductase n=1 Tax=Candidatus Protochlamydia phocaeensis TaxID=1414722 RepID=UPI000837CCEF|nr:FAD-dependent oxidoreductase [Candidatus Protochlamydia phocaeensis]
MHIAVIGTGFCGLAVAWHLLNHPSLRNLHIQLFDNKEIGKGTSGIAAGLLHPFAGAHAKLNRMGREGMEETKKLIEVSAQALKKSVTAPQPGILRLALTEEQQQDYQRCAQLYPEDVEWLGIDQCQMKVPGCAAVPGLWIKQGLILHSALYLQGLWLACQEKGASFELRSIKTLEELNEFDHVIIAAGAHTRNFAELSHLPLSIVKGQVLELAWPPAHPSLPCALNSQAYLLMTPGQQTCLAGATYERGWSHAESQPEVAKADILPKIAAMLPYLGEAPLIGCYAGLRAVTPNHLPLLFQLPSRQWVLTGMGSKGLLYHALMAKTLVQRLADSL